MNIFEKLIFLCKKPKTIIVTGNSRETTAEAIFCLLSQNFKVKKFREELPDILSIYKKEILILSSDLTKSTPVEKFKFLVRKSQLPILVITRVGDIPADKDFFAGDKKDTIQSRKLAKILPAQGYLILNFDDETVREIRGETNLKEITFGFQEGADFRASDIKLNSGTNFKINYKGNIVPIWLAPLPNLSVGVGKEQIYSALSAAAVGTILGLNLVEISNALKNYNPILGET